ncbi:dihydroneopterin aldolase [Amaricoccus sp.]|uniref:dihydroneopterin aldolase n=1 Tax=Amaricoccus sp. TaxID=1872485 RepID=UPI001B6FE42D|nr:dihydroneopterin aldolase [Amaricoccus sp.]MBP7000144.1 dihydroneopterin aldolase [Amaricoccus sp.]
MNETAIAFEPPHVRAAASAEGQPPDRISLRDHVRAVEIGAFHAERGVTQRVQFDVVLEVASGLAGQGDDVDRVLSYDTIVDAISAALAAERLNLLETLAERVAAGCLADRRAVRAFVRVQKLDRAPGALGVEIVRRRLPEGAARLHAPEAPASPGVERVVHLGPAALAGPQAGVWLAAARAAPRAVLTVSPATPQPPARDEAGFRIGLLALDQAAWALSGRAAGLAVATSRAELEWAARAGSPAVWAPARMLADAAPRPALDASRPADAAAWLAGLLGATELVLCGAEVPAQVPDGLALRRPDAPAGIGG